MDVKLIKKNRYRWRDWWSEGNQVFLKDCLRPTDPNPVWIPTKPITLCRWLETWSWLPVTAAAAECSQTTLTDLGLELRQRFPWKGRKKIKAAMMQRKRADRMRDLRDKEKEATLWPWNLEEYLFGIIVNNGLAHGIKKTPRALLYLMDINKTNLAFGVPLSLPCPRRNPNCSSGKSVTSVEIDDETYLFY